ncbi:axin isoform X4 [Bombus vosnesenskii]|uniref:Axin isoform X4 n=3 Tax=Pyrobombus TaxID=144703 RepID=A0A6J3JX45_9HYME|nr:axin isoform X4 [Bombus impatiens]XP_033306008.1 axin isoform X4 [Bombus bifarius]XP_033345368.1 axin isoform X4 [Bombus vosnesenskii]
MKAIIDRMSGSRQNEARCFNENSPRPPVPGEETGNYISRVRPQSPTLTPRRSSLTTPTAAGCDASAPLGFEPEGCCSTTTMESDSPPACLRWARNLHSLLQDPVGLELFRKYLDQEGRPHANPLNFWFACEGLKEQDDPERINQLVKLIYRKFFLKSQLAIPEDVRKEANRRVKEGRVDEKVFDAVQLEVERLINETTYPNFLRSDMYLQYVQSCQNPDSGGCPSSGSSREMSVSCGPSLLPTVHEDSEFVSSIHSSHSASETPGELRGELRLTKDMLMATQQTRAMDLRPKPEADGASMSKQRSKKQYIRQSRAIKDSASLNRDPLAHHTIIPRTQRVPRDLMRPLKPEKFAQVLIEKLENVKRERESQEKFDRHLQESDTINKDASLEMSSGAPKALADALREKLMIEEDNDQAILDQHVSRVWSDLTPSRSPGLSSPRLHSPERRRSTHNYPRPYKQRKEKDVFSTFSADSGNIHDFQEGSDLVGAGSMSSLGSHLPKSKSVPSDYADSLHKQDLYLQGHDQRFRRSDMTRRSATKKSMTELTDSGVSVVSDVPPSTISKDIRLLSWLKETDKKADIKHSRHGKKYGSRSGSLERTNRETWGVPAQPFVADPGMPPLPQPHTATQLEEARRRLIEEDRARSSCKQRHSNISKQSSYEPTMQSQSYVQSNQSTLKKTKQDIGDFTTVVFSFCDEQFPYRTKIPGHNVTLKQFKEYLPKKGSYRYFFKTECEDLDTKVIQEEITDDSEVLPLWEGKVMAQVKALE